MLPILFRIWKIKHLSVQQLCIQSCYAKENFVALIFFLLSFFPCQFHFHKRYLNIDRCDHTDPESTFSSDPELIFFISCALHTFAPLWHPASVAGGVMATRIKNRAKKKKKKVRDLGGLEGVLRTVSAVRPKQTEQKLLASVATMGCTSPAMGTWPLGHWCHLLPKPLHPEWAQERHRETAGLAASGSDSRTKTNKLSAPWRFTRTHASVRKRNSSFSTSSCEGH